MPREPGGDHPLVELRRRIGRVRAVIARARGSSPTSLSRGNGVGSAAEWGSASYGVGSATQWASRRSELVRPVEEQGVGAPLAAA